MSPGTGAALRRRSALWISVWLVTVVSLVIGGLPPARAQSSAPVSAPVVDRAAIAAVGQDGHGIVPMAVTGTKRVMVLRVRFNDYTNTSRYTRSQVEGFFGQLDQLWRNTSYGKINIEARVTDLYALPDNRSAYIDDFSDGDLSKDGKFWKVLNDAINNAPSGLDWSNLDAIMVVMAETSTAQFHRGQGKGGCTLKQGPSGSNKSVGCAIFSENPSDSDVAVWGRWAHEIGHAFQENATPAHPSNYNNEFELMDSNYPGQTGVFEKQPGKAFTGWTPPDYYQNFVPRISGGAPAWAPAGSAVGGGLINLRAMEYDPATAPNFQAARVYITSSLYYLVSARRRVLGDDLNADFGGIPDEGVLIERVLEGGNSALNDCSASDPCPRWVEVKGPGGDRNKLWKGTDNTNTSFFGDGALISIGKKLDGSGDNWEVRISYDLSPQPDVMISPWRSAPGNAWETTDIWVDSPVNGYGTYRYGTWTSNFGDTVPRGNGDDPTVGQNNRIYARIRNLGTTVATDVRVRIDRTTPEGKGINGANGFVELTSGSGLTQAQFPGLASIPPGGYVDVWVNYTPSFTPTPEQIAAGTFYFHTCVRVRIETVAGETVLGNQDGDGEQENIDYFQAVAPTSPGAAQYTDVIRLRNDDAINTKFFDLSYTSELPDGWQVEVNNGNLVVKLGPGEVRDIPILIAPGGSGPDPAPGTTFAVEVQANYQRDMVNPLLPALRRKHFEFKPLGGVRVEAKVMLPAKISCEAQWITDAAGNQQVIVKGQLDGIDRYDKKNPPRVMIEGWVNQVYLTPTLRVLTVDERGQFIGTLLRPRDPRASHVVCLFGGTETLASVGAGPTPIKDAPPPTTGTITPDTGGTLVADRFRLRVPPGAFNERLDLTYTPVFSPTWTLPKDVAWLGSFTLSAQSNGKPVTKLNKPYTMEISYDPLLADQLGFIEPNLNLLYWDGQAWAPLLPCAGCGIDRKNRTLVIVADRFSEFAIIATGRRYTGRLPLTQR